MNNPYEAIDEHSTIALQSNRLLVEGKTLRADVLKDSRSEKISVSSLELEKVLLLGRTSLLNGIEDFYDNQVAKNPGLTIVRPSIWTAQLGTTSQTDGRNSKVFTEKGYNNGGIIQEPDELQPSFHGHWNAVKEAGFLPEVRRASGPKDGGSWLLLRKPSLGEVLHHWFAHSEDEPTKAIEAIRDEDKDWEKRKLRIYRMMGEKAVDAAPDSVRSREQIALILSMAAIKSGLGDKDGYEEEVDDALTYANNDSTMDIGAVRAIENSIF